MIDIIKVFLDNNLNLQISISSILLIVLFSIIIVLLFARGVLRKNGHNIEIDAVEIGIGNNKIKIKPDYFERQLAYQLWVEMSTRKIGIEFEEDRDSIFEIYNSWYNFFGIARNIIKEIPIHKIRTDRDDNLIELSIKVLNLGLRPHLTKWQSRFRHWYDKAIADGNLCPQDCQKGFPEYDLLIKDLLETNRRMKKYSEVLFEIAFRKG